MKKNQFRVVLIFSEPFHLAVDRIHLNTWWRCSKCKQIFYHLKAKSITFEISLRMSRTEAHSLSYSRSTVNSVGELHHFETFPLFRNHPIHLKIPRFSQLNFPQNWLQTHVNATTLAHERDNVRPWNFVSALGFVLATPLRSLVVWNSIEVELSEILCNGIWKLNFMSD